MEALASAKGLPELGAVVRLGVLLLLLWAPPLAAGGPLASAAAL